MVKNTLFAIESYRSRDQEIAPTGRDQEIAPTGRDQEIAPTGRDREIAPTGYNRFMPTDSLSYNSLSMVWDTFSVGKSN